MIFVIKLFLLDRSFGAAAIEIAEKRKVEKKYLDEYKSLLETYKK
jgi:hypothetical protein